MVHIPSQEARVARAGESARIAEFKRLCRERGLAITVQRRVIFEAILDRTDHPTADQIYDGVSKQVPGISRTTVYRVLETFADIGVVTKACSPGAATRFDAVTRHHHHLVCRSCEKLIDLEDAKLDASVRLPNLQTTQFEIHDFSVHFHGICAACRRKREASKRKSSARTNRARNRSVKRRGQGTPRKRSKP
jgi:Fur family peroxide stress response transcriptional regulator